MKNCIPDELFNGVPYPYKDIVRNFYSKGPSDGETRESRRGFDSVPPPEEEYDPVSPIDSEGLDRMFSEIRYKVPIATDALVKREIWHSVYDLCTRTGALIEMNVGTGGQCDIYPRYGKFLRLVGAGTDNGPVWDIRVREDLKHVDFTSDSGDNYILYSTLPNMNGMFDESTTWDPKLPVWFVDKYCECVTHGALMRIYSMASKQWADPAMARFHAVAYNNDIIRHSVGLITSGMRKKIAIDVEDILVRSENGNG